MSPELQEKAPKASPVLTELRNKGINQGMKCVAGECVDLIHVGVVLCQSQDQLQTSEVWHFPAWECLQMSVDKRQQGSPWLRPSP